jgi:hypothetical protein
MILLGEETVTLRTYAATTWGSDGRPVAGASTDASIKASVQVANGDDMKLLPEGFRASETIKLYTTTALQPADQHDGTEADRIVRDSIVYQVQHVEPQHPLIPHYKALATRLREAG